MTSTLLTILPGQGGGGFASVLPSTTTRAGAESASPGQEAATSNASTQAKPSAARARFRSVRFSAALTKVLQGRQPRFTAMVAARDSVVRRGFAGSFAGTARSL